MIHTQALEMGERGLKFPYSSPTIMPKVAKKSIASANGELSGTSGKRDINTPSLSEGICRDELGDLLDVGGAGELEDHGAQAGEHQLKLTVQVEVAGSLDGEGLDLAVGQGGEVLLLAGEALDIDRYHPLVGKDHVVPHGGVGANHQLAGSEEIQNILFLGVLVQAELDDGFVVEVDHGDSPLGFKIRFRSW